MKRLLIALMALSLVLGAVSFALAAPDNGQLPNAVAESYATATAVILPIIGPSSTATTASSVTSGGTKDTAAGITSASTYQRTSAGTVTATSVGPLTSLAGKGTSVKWETEFKH